MKGEFHNLDWWGDKWDEEFLVFNRRHHDHIRRFFLMFRTVNEPYLLHENAAGSTDEVWRICEHLKDIDGFSILDSASLGDIMQDFLRLTSQMDAELNT